MPSALPQVVAIEPTNDCNLRCVMCPRAKARKPIGFMDFALFAKVIDQLVALGVGAVALHLSGEPLLHPRIVEMVAYARDAGVGHVQFATNGTLLDAGVAAGLIAAGLDSLVVSMDAASAWAYCPADAERADVEAIDDNVRRLLSLRANAGADNPKVSMHIIAMSSTADLVPAFLARWRPVVDRVSEQPLLSWAGRVGVTDSVPLRLCGYCI